MFESFCYNFKNMFYQKLSDEHLVKETLYGSLKNGMLYGKISCLPRSINYSYNCSLEFDKTILTVGLGLFRVNTNSMQAVLLLRTYAKIKDVVFFEKRLKNNVRVVLIL